MRFTENVEEVCERWGTEYPDVRGAACPKCDGTWVAISLTAPRWATQGHVRGVLFECDQCGYTEGVKA